MRYSKGAVPVGFARPTLQRPCCLPLWGSPNLTLQRSCCLLLLKLEKHKEQGGVGVGVGGRGSPSGKTRLPAAQSRGRKERVKATSTCLCLATFSPLKVAIFSPKSTHFYGARACLCNFPFQREVFCF